MVGIGNKMAPEHVLFLNLPINKQWDSNPLNQSVVYFEEFQVNLQRFLRFKPVEFF